MTERDDNGGKSGRQPAEGVRIIKAEEAQAALEAGEAAGRRPDSQLRFGDVPPVPSGPRPAHRFPLPDSVDPAEAVALPPLASPRRPGDGPGRRPAEQPEPSSDWRAVNGDEDDVEYEEYDHDEQGGFDRSDQLEEQPFEAASRTAGPGAAPGPSPAAPLPPQTPPAPSPQAQPTPPPAPSPEVQPTASRSALPPDAPLGDEEAPPPTALRWSEDVRPAGWKNEPPAFSPSTPDWAADLDAPPEPATLWEPPPAAEHTPYDKEPLTSMESPWRSNPAPMFEGGDDRTTEMSVPEEGITVSGGMAEMPHWTDPPTGEVPRLRFDDEGDIADDDDMEAWKAIGSRGVRWRDEDDWDDADELSDLVSEEEPIGALDSSRAEHSDIYSFDEDFERVTNRTGAHPAVDLTAAEDEEDEDPGFRRRRSRARRPERTPPRSQPRRSSGVRMVFDDDHLEAERFDEVDDGSDEPDRELVRAGRQIGARPARRGSAPRRPVRPAGGPPPRTGRGGPEAAPASGGELGSRVGIGAALVALLILCYAIGAVALVALTMLVVVAAAAEAYAMIRGAGFRPATLLGLVATAGCVLAAYWKGPGAIPVVTVFLLAGTMLWYVMGIVEARPLANVAVTVMVFVWVGVLGSFAAVMLAQHSGQGEFLGAVVVAVAADVAAFAVGRWIGSRPLAAHISPNKTVEGFVGGLIGALIAGAIIGKELTPWGGMKHGLVLGLIVGLVAPVGDLFESMLKRDLGLKDSGTILAGHGGLLDRFDGVLLALPAAYFVITFFKL